MHAQPQVMEVHPSLMTCHVTDGLTEDAVSARLHQGYPFTCFCAPSYVNVIVSIQRAFMLSGNCLTSSICVYQHCSPGPTL